MKKIGIIDIGSNSVRLVVAQAGPGGSFKIIDSIKDSVRLGQNLGPGNDLNAAKMEQALDTLRFFKDLCGALEADPVLVVATEAVRRSANQKQFLSLAQSKLGFDVRVISGAEEAFYDYLGVVNSMDIRDGLIMDIGGSSTELILVNDRQLRERTSIHWGAINLTDQYNGLNASNAQHGHQFREFLLQIYRDIPWLQQDTGSPLIGIGGTMRNIGRIDRKKANYPLDITHNYHFTAQDLSAIYYMVKDTDLRHGKKIRGLSRDRTDIFTGAVAAAKHLVEYCRIQEIYISGSGLREGIAYQYLLGNDTPVADVLAFSLDNVISYLGLNRDHAYQIWCLFSSLFEQLKPVHKIEQPLTKVIKTAALLHDAGITINYYDHHKHSFYMILNSDLHGLSHRELLMAACVAGSHRKDDFKITIDNYSLLINDADLLLIRQLGVLLKLCESFDRRKQRYIREVRCAVQGDTVTMKLDSEAEPRLEMDEARESGPLFEKLFGKKLAIV